MTPVRAKIFIAGMFLSFLATQFLLFVIPLMIFESEGNISSLGALMSIEWLPALFAFPLAGHMIDRFSAIKINRYAHLIRAFLCLLAYFLLQSFPDNLFIIMALLASICAFLMGFVKISADTLISVNFKDKEMAKYHSMLQSAELSSMMLGAVLAGIASTVMDNNTLLMIAGCIFMIAFTATLPITSTLKKSGAVATSFIKSVQFGMEFLKKTPRLKGIVLLNASFNLMVGLIMGLNPAIVVSTFSMEKVYFGYLNTAGGVATVLGLLMIPWILKKISVNQMGLFGGIFCLGSGIAMVLAPNYYVYVALFVCYLLGLSFYNIFNRTERAKLVPKDKFGSVMGVFYVINSLSLPLAGLVIYLVADHVAPQLLIFMMAITATVACFALYLIYFKNTSSEPVVEDTVEGTVEEGVEQS